MLAPVALSPGAQTFELHYRALGSRQGQAALCLNGVRYVDEADLSPTMLRIPNSGMSVGMSRRLSVNERYAHRGAFSYTGPIEQVRIQPGALAPGSHLEPSEALVQERLRAIA